jgi:hypothetical protein
MSHPAPDPDPVRARGIEFEVSLAVDRSRDLDRLASDLIDAVWAVLVSHGRRGEISFVRLSPDDGRPLVDDRIYRRERPAQ